MNTKHSSGISNSGEPLAAARFRRAHVPTEGARLLDDILAVREISRADLRRLSQEDRGVLIGEIRTLLKSPEIREILESRRGAPFSAEHANCIRKILGLEKWSRLSLMVAYVRTLVGEGGPGDRELFYQRHLSLRVDQNEIRRLLACHNDVAPARIDTDIRHQSSSFYRAVVELVSNAVDASLIDRLPIGRFGVGFYQILNHLQCPQDRVIVRTRAEHQPEGIRIEFRAVGGEVELAIRPDPSITSKGTEVTLISSEFEPHPALAIVRKHFSHTQDVELIVNGEELKSPPLQNVSQGCAHRPRVEVEFSEGRCQIIDHGCGMSPLVVFEKLLPPKLSNKPPLYELRNQGLLQPKLFYASWGRSSARGGEIIIQVGGIEVERHKVEGVNTARTLVLDLPPATILGEQRDEICVDHFTVQAMKELIDQAVRLPKPDCFAVLNSLGKACQAVQSRSSLYEAQDNLVLYLQKAVRSAFAQYSFLPNQPDFLELELNPQNATLLDPAIVQSDLHFVPGLVPAAGICSTRPVFTAPFRQESLCGIIVTNDFILIDRRIPLNSDRELLEKAFCHADCSINIAYQDQAQSKGFAQIGEAVPTETPLTPRAFAKANWEQLFFGSPEIAERSATILEGSHRHIAAEFTAQILSRLPASAVPDGWSLLRHYILVDKRPETTRLAEIKALAKNIDALLEDSYLRDVIDAYGIPLFSAFETIAAELPPFLCNRNKSPQGTARANGKLYYIYEKSDRDSSTTKRLYLGENGEAVFHPKDRDVLFQDRQLRVYHNRVEDLSGNLLQAFSEEDEAQAFIEDRFNPQILNTNNLVKNNEEGIRKPNSSVTTAEGVRYDITPAGLLIDGVLRPPFQGIDQPLQEVLLTRSGRVIILAHRQELGRNFYDNEAGPERFYILDADGQVLWSFDEAQFGDKVVGDDRESKWEGSLGNQMQRRFARCIILPHDAVINDNQEIVAVARFHLHYHRFRELLAAVDGSGSTYDLYDGSRVNALTLRARYAWESYCGCCPAHHPFQLGSYEPFDKETKECLLPNLQRIPVNIIGEFQFDPEKQEWVALARQDDGGQHFLAVFNKDGAYLRTERLGRLSDTQIQSIIRSALHNPGDFRDLEAWYASRLPRSLQGRTGNERDPESQQQYLDLLRRRVSLGERTLLCRANWNYGYDSELQERTWRNTGLLNEASGTLSPDKVEVLSEFLQTLSAPARPSLERLFFRMLEFRNLTASQLKLMLPAFYSVEDLQPSVCRPEIVQLLLPLSYLDNDRIAQVIALLHRMLPEELAKALGITRKLVAFYCERLQSESASDIKNLNSALYRTIEFEDGLILDGFSIIRLGAKVMPHQLPRQARPLITFMLHTEEELARRNFEGINLPRGERAELLLSEVVQWKRLRESVARCFAGGPAELKELVDAACRERRRDHIQREITHAIHFQALNAAELYIRELVQNGVDALNSTAAPEELRELRAEIGLGQDATLRFSFHDPVGMDVNTLINCFLVPGESSKLDRKSIGFYGQGVYTLFKGCDEVVIKTADGTGTAWYLRMTPILEHELVVDLRLEFITNEESHRGTTVLRTKSSGNPYVEAACIRDAAVTLAAGMDEGHARLVVQNEQLNRRYPKLAAEPYRDDREVSIYRNPNNTLTQHGLYVREIDNIFWNQVPRFMSETLRGGGGIVIDLPGCVELTRSRQDIAAKEKIADELNPAVGRALVRAYLNTFQEAMEKGQAEFPETALPGDYFSESYPVPDEIREDAQKLLRGEQLINVSRYRSSTEAIKLLSLLPLFHVDGEPWSLDDIKCAWSTQKPPFDKDNWRSKLCGWLVRQLDGAQQKSLGDIGYRRDRLVLKDAPLEEILRAAPAELRSWMENHHSELAELEHTSREFLAKSSHIFLGDRGEIPLFFYYDEDQSVAHASRQNRTIGWNIASLKSHSWSSPLSSSKQDTRELRQAQIRRVEILSHEFAHLLEGLYDWTHDARHRLLQARVLMQYLRGE